MSSLNTLTFLGIAVLVGASSTANADALSFSVNTTGCLDVPAAIVLTSPAPLGGRTFALSSSSADAIPPASVTVPEGATAAAFTIATRAVAAQLTAVIAANDGSSALDRNLTLRTMTPSDLGLSPHTVGVGEAALGTVTLVCNAAPGDVTVALSSDNTAIASVPATITVQAGQRSATFTATGGNTAGQALLTATAGGVSKIDRLTVKLPSVTQINWIPTASPIGGDTVPGTLVLDAPAPTGGVSVTVTSGSSLVTVLDSPVLIPAGATTGTFTIATSNVDANTPVSLTAAANGSTYTESITLRPNRIVNYSLDTDTIAVCGRDATYTIELVAPAGPDPLVVSLSNPRPDIVTPHATTVVVQPGETTASVTFSAASRPLISDLATLSFDLNGRSFLVDVYVPRISRVACR